MSIKNKALFILLPILIPLLLSCVATPTKRSTTTKPTPEASTACNSITVSSDGVGKDINSALQYSAYKAIAKYLGEVVGYNASMDETGKFTEELNVATIGAIKSIQEISNTKIKSGFKVKTLVTLCKNNIPTQISNRTISSISTPNLGNEVERKIREITIEDNLRKYQHNETVSLLKQLILEPLNKEDIISLNMKQFDAEINKGSAIVKFHLEVNTNKNYINNIDYFFKNYHIKDTSIDKTSNNHDTFVISSNISNIDLPTAYEYIPGADSGDTRLHLSPVFIDSLSSEYIMNTSDRYSIPMMEEANQILNNKKIIIEGHNNKNDIIIKKEVSLNKSLKSCQRTFARMGNGDWYDLCQPKIKHRIYPYTNRNNPTYVTWNPLLPFIVFNNTWDDPILVNSSPSSFKRKVKNWLSWTHEMNGETLKYYKTKYSHSNLMYPSDQHIKRGHRNHHNKHAQYSVKYIIMPNTSRDLELNLNFDINKLKHVKSFSVRLKNKKPDKKPDKKSDNKTVIDISESTQNQWVKGSKNASVFFDYESSESYFHGYPKEQYQIKIDGKKRNVMKIKSRQANGKFLYMK